MEGAAVMRSQQRRRQQWRTRASYGAEQRTRNIGELSSFRQKAQCVVVSFVYERALPWSRLNCNITNYRVRLCVFCLARAAVSVFLCVLCNLVCVQHEIRE
ncbi:unnamed protein product [Ectocarpus sp. 6 AP-2014]